MRTRMAGPAFAQWLTTQLAITGISRRQLAQLSGVDHSTISRLTLGQRMPSLETATKLARVLPDLRDHLQDVPALQGISQRTTNPPARLEYALRSDEALSREDVRAIMDFYFGVRTRALAEQARQRGERPRSSSEPTVRRLQAVPPANARSRVSGSPDLSGARGTDPRAVAPLVVRVPRAAAGAS